LTAFDPEKVRRLQKAYRGGLMRHRLQSLVMEYRDSKTSEGMRKRASVLREIVATEESYVKALYCCITHFFHPLREKARTKWVATPEDVSHLFSTLEIIYQLNSEILIELQTRISQWPAVNTFSDIFHKMIPMLKMYTTYINTYDDAMAIYHRLSGNKEFTDFLSTCQKDSGGLLDLPSLLIQPVQRLPRYQLLLTELKKHTEDTHVDFNNIVEAIQQIKELNQYVNDRKRERDNANFILRLQDKIANMPIVLAKPHRVFIKEGETTGSSTKISKKRKSMVHLFNDMAIRSHVVKAGEKYDFEESITFSGVELTALQGTRFTLRKPEGDWEFSCSDGLEAQEWYKQFKSTIDAWQLQETCTAQIASSKEGLRILSATYGELSEPKYCIEVTQQLQDMVNQQGGDKLEIPAGESKSKLPGFIDPIRSSPLFSPFKHLRYKKKLNIVWSDSHAAHTRTYSDEEGVYIVMAK
jgi:hypothetical protein